jgi:hypothetical protein
MNKWIITTASTIGSGHIAANIPCQDASCALLSENGKWAALVVSDGAGTAKYSDKSSSLVSASFAKALIELSGEIERREPGAWINDFVIEHIISTRKELRSMAGLDSLQNYHCTLVACLLGSSGGFLIHIGDGAIFGGSTKNVSKNKVSLSHAPIASLPENGEYSNETYFITEGDWIKHLRITPIPAIDWIVLGTDGGTTLAMIGDKEPKPGFIVPLLNLLTKDTDEASRVAKLKAILSDAQADKLTSDDKTLCIAYTTKLADETKEFEMDIDDAKPSSVTPVNTHANLSSHTPNKSSATNLGQIKNTIHPISQPKPKWRWKRLSVWVSLIAIVFSLFALAYVFAKPTIIKYLDDINLLGCYLKGWIWAKN